MTVIRVKLINTLMGNESRVKEIIYSPDGRRLASVGLKTVNIWDVKTGACLLNLDEHQEEVTSVVYSPDGRSLASAGYNTVKIWDAESGTCLRTLTGHRGTVISVVYSSDGQNLACGSFTSETLSGRGDSYIQIWGVKSGVCLRTLSGPNAGVRRILEGKAVAYTPDGKRVAISIDKTIKIWDVETGACLKTLNGHDAGVRAVAYSPDGKIFASGSGDKTIKIWEAESGACLSTLNEHKDGVTSVAFSPDGKSLASGSDDNTIKIWEVDEPGEQQYQKELARSTDNMGTSELLHKIASGAKQLQLVQVEEQSITQLQQLKRTGQLDQNDLTRTEQLSSSTSYVDLKIGEPDINLYHFGIGFGGGQPELLELKCGDLD